jgi:hypothetical protein
MSVKALSHKADRLSERLLLSRIAELEALVAEQEQGRMYHVVFDLRELTRQERDQLEAINDAWHTRKIARSEQQ